MSIKKLPVKQRLFIKYYLADPKRNVYKAAVAAGYSERTAASQGRRLLQNVAIKAEIEKGIRKIEKTLDFDAIDVIKRLKDIGFSKITDVLSFDQKLGVQLKSSCDLTDAQIAGIESIQLSPKTGFKIKMEAKKPALESLKRYFKDFSDAGSEQIPQIDEDDAERLIDKALSGKAKTKFK